MEEIEGKLLPFWLANTEQTAYPKLTGNLQTEVAVIGGGIAGLTAAYLLLMEGKKVTVFESRRIAEQVTGHTTAKITLNHGLIYHYLVTNYGQDKAQTYANANISAINLIKQFIEDLKIDCDFFSAAAYSYTLKKERIPDFKDELKAAKSLGLNVEYAEGEIGLPFKVSAAFKMNDQFRFHPRKYLLRLAEEIIKLGGEIYEQTKIEVVEERENLIRLKSNDCWVEAQKAVVATNFPIYDPLKFYTRTLFGFSYVLAARLNSQVPRDMYLNMDSDDNHSCRPQYFSDHEDLAIIGGEDHPNGYVANTKERYVNLEKWAKANFDVKEILYRWATHDVNPADQIPYIGQQSPLTWVITGLKEWGMTQATLGAVMVRDQILGRENPWSDLYNPKRIKNQITKEILSQQFQIVKGMVKEYLARNDRLQNPKCTHLGCFLTANNAEKTWDCPCHGSRFDHDGKPLHSPAIKNLPKKRS